MNEMARADCERIYQVDIVEVMEIREGKIAAHRIYWGWLGLGLLSRNAMTGAGRKK